MKLLMKFQRNATGELWHFGNYVAVEMGHEKAPRGEPGGAGKSR